MRIPAANDITEDSTDDDVRNRITRLASESSKLHRKLVVALWEAYGYKHGNRTITNWMCKK